MQATETTADGLIVWTAPGRTPRAVSTFSCPSERWRSRTLSCFWATNDRRKSTVRGSRKTAEHGRDFLLFPLLATLRQRRRRPGHTAIGTLLSLGAVNNRNNNNNNNINSAVRLGGLYDCREYPSRDVTRKWLCTRRTRACRQSWCYPWRIRSRVIIQSCLCARVWFLARLFFVLLFYSHKRQRVIITSSRLAATERRKWRRSRAARWLCSPATAIRPLLSRRRLPSVYMSFLFENRCLAR